MTQVDTFGVYVRARLDGWGREFALHRDQNWLGYASRNMLQVLIDHKGEMPPPNVGFKPLEVDRDAHDVELMVTDIARSNMPMACVLRAYYCGAGRRRVERWETANLLISNITGNVINQRAYLAMAAAGTDIIGQVLYGKREAA